MKTPAWLSGVLFCTLNASGLALAAVPLPPLLIDQTQTTVSGLSAGGYMAVQLHVAYSATFKRGAAVAAGGPFYCAEGVLSNATGRCMKHDSLIPVAGLANITNNWATQGLVDPVENLQSSKVFLFSGTQDSVVKTAVMDDLLVYYKNFVPTANIQYKKDIGAEHSMVTDDYGNACNFKGTPYINNCGFDLAGAFLQQLYGPLNARNNGTLTGQFMEFNQSAFVTGHGMAATGWVYVPQSCAAGQNCRLHVVLHGCKQNSVDVGQQYVRNTGYPRWADNNKLVLLFPQTSASATNSCWDWWGYDSANYAKKSGPQMAAIKAMVDVVSSGTPPSSLPAPTGLAASGATASSMSLVWNSVPGAASYKVLRNGAVVNTTPIATTQYQDTGLAAGTSYTWTVKAVDSANFESVASTPAVGTTTGSATVCYTASNYDHWLAGRATALYGLTYAVGSGNYMGLWNVWVTSTLKKTGVNYYVLGTCP